MKILVISTSGAHRISKIVKILQEDGHKIKILTSKKYKLNRSDSNYIEYNLSDVNVIEEPYFPYEKIKSYHTNNSTEHIKHVPKQTKECTIKKYLRKLKHTMGTLPELFNFWIGAGYKQAINIYSSWEFDIIVSTYGPSASHIVASRIKKKLNNVYWIADYRDLWSGNYNRNLPKFTTELEKYIERKTVKNADRIMTVSPALKEYLNKLFPSTEIWSIRHGFNKKYTLDKNTKMEEKDVVCIRYTGTIYEKQDLFLILEGLKILNEEAEQKYKLEIYGNANESTREIIKKYDWVEFFPGVSREKSLYLQRSSDLLLILEWNDPSQQGVAPSKMFDYLATQVPIISVGDYRNDSANIIEEIGIGKFCSTTSEVVDFLRSYKEISSDNDILNKYTTHQQMKPFLSFLKDLNS